MSSFGTVLYRAAYIFLAASLEILTSPLWILSSVPTFHRPVAQWTFQQAVRMKFLRRLIYHWSVLRAAPPQSLKPGPEGKRFVMIPPAKPMLYGGPLKDGKIVPKDVGDPKSDVLVVLHFHGGAFVIGSGRDSDTGFLAKTLIKHMGCTHVLTPQYRLASYTGGCFPAALQDALTSYSHLVNDLGIPASRIIFSGDSAGGNIALGLLRYITEYGSELGIPAPGAVTLWSPWVDLTPALDPQNILQSPNYKSDYLSQEFGLWGASTLTDSTRINPDDPYLSPLSHPFQFDTPAFVQTGEREVLFHENEKLVEQFHKLGIPTELFVSPHAPHDIMLVAPVVGFREHAERAARQAGEFLRRHRLMAAPGITNSEATRFDVVIVGAGISGINTAYRIQEAGVASSYAILEGRGDVGGTWDLFRYPGIRSDSDILSFGFPWNPWPKRETLAAGEDIKEYLKSSAKQHGIDQHIQFHHKVLSAQWHTDSSDWTIEVLETTSGQQKTYRARFIVLGTGYYDYEHPLEANIPGIKSFKGPVVHPQFWPEDFDYTNQNVVVIGSGATAITLVPSMTEKARHVTMLQRSPSYVASIPSEDTIGKAIHFLLPKFFAVRVCRLFNIFRTYLLYLFCIKYPNIAKKGLAKAAIKQLPPDIPWDPHFKPSYNPWRQRLCVAPRGDFFAALRAGKASVVTDTIEVVTEKGINLTSGQTLYPDAIITATGLKVKFAGGIKLSVDGRSIDASEKFAWKTTMLQDVPNCFFMMGYANASWTLGAEASAQLIVRLLRNMKQKGALQAVPYLDNPGAMEKTPVISLASTYLKTASLVFPKTGAGQWGTRSNYFRDMYRAKWGDIVTGLRVQ
ncbi:FAD/NAD(P)-binding domain-containing protein [Thozetella sp. PMI_491]|nr:FAD/NAD(P)-binding domain-containing protein [Thozetella sp. PMI_491]